MQPNKYIYYICSQFYLNFYFKMHCKPCYPPTLRQYNILSLSAHDKRVQYTPTDKKSNLLD